MRSYRHRSRMAYREANENRHRDTAAWTSSRMTGHVLAALCGSGGGIWLGLLLAGATGSMVHCVPMCGPFVLGQVADRMARLPAARLCEMQRISGALLLP